MALGSKMKSDCNPKHQYLPKKKHKDAVRTVAPRPASHRTMTESNTIQLNIAEDRNLATKPGGNSTLPLRRYYECTWVPQKHP